MTCKRSSLVPKITKNSEDIKEAFNKYLADYFGDHYDGRLSEQLEAAIFEIEELK